MVRGRVKSLFITSIMIIFSLFIYSTPTYAMNITGTSQVLLNTNSYLYTTDFSERATGGDRNGIAFIHYANSSARITSFYLCGDRAIPAHSYFSLTITSVDGSNNYIPFVMTPNDGAYSLENISYGEYGRSTATFYTQNGINSCWYLRVSGNNTFVSTNQRIDVSPISVITFEDDGFTQTQRDRILDYLNWTSGATSNTSTIAGDILVELRDMQDNQEQQQQDQEQQGQQSQTDSNSAGQQVEGATTNLISVIGGFFGAFINASPTNCVFNMGIILEEVDMCSAYIPTTYNVILSIVSLLFIVPMVIWLINSILNAFREFQE